MRKAKIKLRSVLTKSCCGCTVSRKSEKVVFGVRLVINLRVEGANVRPLRQRMVPAQHHRLRIRTGRYLCCRSAAQLTDLGERSVYRLSAEAVAPGHQESIALCERSSVCGARFRRVISETHL